MKFLNRIISAIIAFAIISALANCSKDTQVDYSGYNSDYSYPGDGSNGRNSLANDPNYRIILNSTPVSTVPALCGIANTKNFIKSGIAYGQITVGNDSSDYYLSIDGVSGWVLKEIRLYAGSEINIPVSPGNGVPQIGQYPVNETMQVPYPASWSIKVDIDELGSDFWVSSRVTFINGSGTTETVWSQGNLFSPISSSSKFECEEQECVVNEGCAHGQGHWFGTGNQSWPDANGAAAGDITLGAEDYTRDELMSIWTTINGSCQGIPDVKKAFGFVAAIKLSGTSVIGNTDFWNDVAAVDAWLESLDRLSDSNICNHPEAPIAIKEAIARIGDWIIAHHC